MLCKERVDLETKYPYIPSRRRAGSFTLITHAIYPARQLVSPKKNYFHSRTSCNYMCTDLSMCSYWQPDCNIHVFSRFHSPFFFLTRLVSQSLTPSCPPLFVLSFPGETETHAYQIGIDEASGEDADGLKSFLVNPTDL